MMYGHWLLVLTVSLASHAAGAEFVQPAAPMIMGELRGRQLQQCPEASLTACAGGMGCCPTGVPCTFVFGVPKCAHSTNDQPTNTASQMTSINPGGPMKTTSMSTSESINPGGPMSPASSTSGSNTSGSTSSAPPTTSTTPSSSTTASTASSSPGQASSTAAPGIASLPSADSLSWAAWILTWTTGVFFLA